MNYHPVGSWVKLNEKGLNALELHIREYYVNQNLRVTCSNQSNNPIVYRNNIFSKYGFMDAFMDYFDVIWNNLDLYE